VTKLNKILIAVMIAQLALAAFVLTRDDQIHIAPMQPVLAGFDAATVTRVQVFDKGGDTPAIDLAKVGDDAWKLTSGFDFPVDASKVGDLLTKVAAMKSRGPFATTAVRHEQLGVTDTGFEKKLVLTTPTGDVTVLVGNAEGGRTTAVRLAGSLPVYGVTALTTWGVEATPARWIDTSYLALEPDRVARLSIQTPAGTTELARVASGWQLTSLGQPVALGAGETLDTAAIDRVVNAAATVHLTKPADPARDASKPAATISIWLAEEPVPPDLPGAGSGSDAGAAAGAPGASTAERPADHILDVVADADGYWIKDRGKPTAGIVGKTALDPVVEVGRDKLVTKPAAGGPAKNRPPTPAGPGTNGGALAPP
jgi:hypothetical protein